MQCTKCGKVWCPGEATVCSACTGAAGGAVAANGASAPAPAGPRGNRAMPTGNPAALVAYYLGFLAFVPVAGTFVRMSPTVMAVLGIAFGIAAAALGIHGVRVSRRRPEARGGAHAWTGIILGVVFTIGWIVVLSRGGKIV